MTPADTTDAFLGRSPAAETIRRLDGSNNPLGPIRNEVLTRSSGNAASITGVIEGALAPHQGALGEICAQGPPLSLSLVGTFPWRVH